MIYPKIKTFIEQRLNEFEMIPAERKEILEKIAGYIQKKHEADKVAKLIYICIHNSRRSHFGHIAADLAARYFNVNNVAFFSGGTIATAFNSNAIEALRNIGFTIKANDSGENPKYDVYFTDEKPTLCFSKMYDDPSNPQSGFAAIMTCGEAEENCPFIPAAEFKIGTTYEDPKVADGTDQVNEVYMDRFAQILRESLYLFSKVAVYKE